jgi:DNA segregation ATPase FtsK/SpoIIIE-like protein
MPAAEGGASSLVDWLDTALHEHAPGVIALARDLSGRVGRSLRNSGLNSDRVLGQSSAPSAAPVPLFALLEQLPPLPPATAVLGLGEGGRPVVLTLAPDEIGHVLIGGDAGAGKSTLLRSMMLSLAAGNRQADLQLVVFDGSAGGDSATAAEWRPLGFLPHALAPVVLDGEEAVEGLAFLAEEMVYRLEQSHRRPRIVVAIDDLDRLLMRHGDAALEPLAGLMASGVRAGCHVLATATDPGALDNVVRGDFGLRLVGRMRDRARVHLLTGEAASAAWHLLGAGDFLVHDGDVTTRFQAAAAGQQDVGRWLRHMRPWHEGALVAAPASDRHTATDQIAVL